MIDFDLEYNSEREHLIIPEYGRHLQKLVNHCIKLETKEQRNEMANAIIDVMWDQLFIMSDFNLDADSPYPQPSKEELTAKPEVLKYPKSASKYKFYGNNIQIMIDTALTWEEGELKDTLIFTIANHMKKCYLNWNKDTVDDVVIFKHLAELSNGKINLTTSDETLSEVKNLLRSKPANKSKVTKSYKKFKKR